MADFTPARSDHAPSVASATGRAVAEDMTAIFGSGVRRDAVPPAAGPDGARRPPGRRGWIATIAGVALLGTIGAGVLAGRTAITDPDPGATASAGRDGARKEAGASQTAGIRLATAGPLATPSPVDRPVANPRVAPAATPADVTGDPVEAAPPPVAPPKPVPVVAVHRAQPAPNEIALGPAPAATVAPVVAPARQRGCDDDSDACLDARFDTAERELAVAYDNAMAAGVGRGDLRAYRSEWDRARGEAGDRPFYALRLYGMITSDLYTLAEDAAHRTRR